MRKIGYARISSVGQHLDRQIAALLSEGCDEIYREKASGKDIRNRPQLEKAIDQLGIGDVLVVAEWDRATRSMMDGMAIVERVSRREAKVNMNFSNGLIGICELFVFPATPTATSCRPCLPRTWTRRMFTLGRTSISTALRVHRCKLQSSCDTKSHRVWDGKSQ